MDCFKENEIKRNEFIKDIEDKIESLIGNYLTKWKPKTFQPLDAVFPNERRIQSVMHGLYTSLGTTLWEKLAKDMAEKNGFTILDEKKFQRQEEYPQKLEKVVAKWEEARRDKKSPENSLTEYVNELKELAKTLSSKKYKIINLQPGEGIDVWLRKDGKEYAFDIKTVQINQSGGLKFNSTLMHWYKYRTLSDPELNFKAYIVFPYNPYIPYTWWEKNGARIFPLIEGEDVLIENNFWDLISGHTNTWELINQAFKNLGDKKLSTIYKDVFYP